MTMPNRIMGLMMELKIQDDDEEIFTLEAIMNHESLSQER